MIAHEHAGAAGWRMLSQTGEYALRAVLHLAERPNNDPVGASDVAAQLELPERYLARVLKALAEAGVLTSTRGAHGGFALAADPADIRLAAVVAPFDAVGERPQCLLSNRVCGEGRTCIAHSRWHRAARQVRDFFQETTVAELIADDPAFSRRRHN